MSLKAMEHLFKSETRSSGRSLAIKGKASQTRPSDTEVQTYIRDAKVILKSDSVGSSSVQGICSCSQFKKGQFCKHLWAALLVSEEKNPDFLEEKNDIQIKIQASEQTVKKTQASQKHEEMKVALRKKQSEYRKQQYQKQKLRMKEQKQLKKGISEDLQFPEPVEKALAYFSNNGFSLREIMTEEAIAFAKKKLARVFHPDRGGTHQESVELNAQAEILLKYAK